MLLQPPKMLKSLGSMAEKRKKTPGATSRTSPNFIFGGSAAIAVGVTLNKDQSTRTGARRMAILRKGIVAGGLTVRLTLAHRHRPGDANQRRSGGLRQLDVARDPGGQRDA